MQAREAELRIAERTGQLVSVEQLEPELVRMVTVFRQRMLYLADQMTSDLTELHGVVIDLAMVEGWVIGALEELSEYDPESGLLPKPAAQASDSEARTGSPTEVPE